MKINKNNKYIVFSKDKSKYAIAPSFYVELYLHQNKMASTELASKAGVKDHFIFKLLNEPQPFSHHDCVVVAKATDTPIRFWERVSSDYLLDLAEINKEKK